MMQIKHVELSQNHMATTFSLRISTSESQLRLAEHTLEKCHQIISSLESELSEFIAVSPVGQFNTAKENIPIRGSDSLIEILRMSRNIEKQTEGAFTCLAKSETRLSFAEAIQIDMDQYTVQKIDGNARISFGAIGKGYALDQVRAEIERAGFQDFVLNAGGSSIIISGFSAPEQPWEWSWSWKKSADNDYEGQDFHHYSGLPVALGISGLMEQGNHLIEPGSKERVKTMASALVAHNSAAYSDALSTALFVSGWEKGLPLLEGPLSSPAVAVIENDETPIWNEIFSDYWGGIRSKSLTAATAIFVFMMSSSLSFANEDEIVDLSELGMDSFNPYLYERNNLWIILPVVILMIVVIHLPLPFRKKIKIKRSSGGQSK